MINHVRTCKRMEQFTEYLFDDPHQVSKAALILKAILAARSPRLSDLSQMLPGKPQANDKMIQRFLAATEPKEALWRLSDKEAPFVLAHPTEIPRPQAKKTEYVGTLSDGRTRGFWLLVLATPYRGRAIPVSFVTYSSQTIAQEGRSRNLEQQRALGEVADRIGERPVVLDREFSYGGLLEELEAEGLKVVIRLNSGRRPRFTDEEGKEVVLSLAKGQRVTRRHLYYRGEIRVTVAGEWTEGFKEPLWVITNLEPEEALAVYRARMKIEESFKDLKDLLGVDEQASGADGEEGGLGAFGLRHRAFVGGGGARSDVWGRRGGILWPEAGQKGGALGRLGPRWEEMAVVFGALCVAEAEDHVGRCSDTAAGEGGGRELPQAGLRPCPILGPEVSC